MAVLVNTRLIGGTIGAMAKIQKRVTLYKCERCGHEWLPRKDAQYPKTCPNRKCRSPYWDRPRQSKP